MDKVEITAEATRLGSYPISIMPDEDCCTLFTPRHPVTRAHPRVIEVAESALPTDDLVRDALERTVLERYSYPSGIDPIPAADMAREQW
jgi:thiamine biosynthesis protein ThiI